MTIFLNVVEISNFNKFVANKPKVNNEYEILQIFKVIIIWLQDY